MTHHDQITRAGSPKLPDAGQSCEANMLLSWLSDNHPTNTKNGERGVGRRDLISLTRRGNEHEGLLWRR